MGSRSAARNLTPLAAFARLRDAARLAHAVRQLSRAEVAELADARGSGPRTRKGVGVRVPSSAPKVLNPIPIERVNPGHYSVGSPFDVLFAGSAADHVLNIP